MKVALSFLSKSSSRAAAWSLLEGWRYIELSKLSFRTYLEWQLAIMCHTGIDKTMEKSPVSWSSPPRPQSGLHRWSCDPSGKQAWCRPPACGESVASSFVLFPPTPSLNLAATIQDLSMRQIHSFTQNTNKAKSMTTKCIIFSLVRNGNTAFKSLFHGTLTVYGNLTVIVLIQLHCWSNSVRFSWGTTNRRALNLLTSSECAHDGWTWHKSLGRIFLLWFCDFQTHALARLVCWKCSNSVAFILEVNVLFLKPTGFLRALNNVRADSSQDHQLTSPQN